MSGNINTFLEEQRNFILNQTKRLSLKEPTEDIEPEQKHASSDEVCQKGTKHFDLKNNNVEKTLWCSSPISVNSEPCFNIHLNLSPRLCGEKSPEEKKEYLINKLSNSTSPLSSVRDNHKGNVIRCGEFSPNNPQVRAATRSTAPYLGVGEYEQVRRAFREQERADYLRHISEKSAKIKQLSKIVDGKNIEKVSSRVPPNRSCLSKSIQTDIQDIRVKLVQYDYKSQNPPEKELSPRTPVSNTRSPLIQNSSFLSPNKTRLNTPRNSNLNRAKSTRHSTVLERTQADADSDTTFLDGFSFTDPKDDLEKERLKRETYQKELKLQIEEKRRLQAIKEDEERKEQEKGNRKLEEQLRQMQMEKEIEWQSENKSKSSVRQRKENLKLDLSIATPRKRTESEHTSSKMRIDLNSPKIQQFANQNVPYSPRSSDEFTPRLRSLSCTSVSSNLKKSGGRGILAQLGDIRAQLLQEQVRMDQTLRKQSRACQK